MGMAPAVVVRSLGQQHAWQWLLHNRQCTFPASCKQKCVDFTFLGRRQLLAHLNAGPRASADPTAFARTLALDHSVQQDGQEFMKLLLTLLERLLRESGNKVGIYPNAE